MADMRNPNDPLDPLDTRSVRNRDLYPERRSAAGWGWILGGVVALLLLFAFVFGYGRNDRVATAPTATTPATTESRAPAAPPPATAQRPAAPAENTGAAPRGTTQ